MASYGLPVSFVDAEEVATRHPLLDVERFAGAIEIADAGFVDDTYVYTRALAQDAQNRGAEFRTGVEVTNISTSGGSAVGVEAPDGTIEAPHVVVATGWRTRTFLADVLEVPTRPFLLQAATVSLDREIGSDFPLGQVPAESVYFRPQTDGQLRLGEGSTSSTTRRRSRSAWGTSASSLNALSAKESSQSRRSERDVPAFAFPAISKPSACTDVSISVASTVISLVPTTTKRHNCIDGTRSTSDPDRGRRPS